MRKLALAAVLAALHTGVALAAPPKVTTTFSLRLRWEDFDTPARTTTVDRTYDLGLARARFGADAAWEHWKLHGLIQAGGVVGVPENGAFAAGPSYFTANHGDTSPSQIGLAELSASYKNEGLDLTLGRQPYGDGFEVPTGVAHLDGVKRRRLGDRLVGISDWPNAGRRFDGVSFGYGTQSAHLAGFALRPLDGTFDHEDAFDELNGVSVYGLTLTGKYGAWIPGTELRAFAIQYEDDRRVAPAGGLSLTTAGASLLHGNGDTDLLLWGALQKGDWGRVDQNAWAVLADLGHRFDDLPGKPAFHLAGEQSSGDTPGKDHRTFFNVLPTNHKFYGSMDYLAFSNLRDLYLESLFSAGQAVKVRAAFHDFHLSEDTDAWYGGAGAFEKESFGYTARLPPSGRYPSKELGRELDADVTWTVRKELSIALGGGHFWGGQAAEAFVPVKADGSWFYLEVNVTK
jgi:hypothetical protein